MNDGAKCWNRVSQEDTNSLPRMVERHGRSLWVHYSGEGLQRREFLGVYSSFSLLNLATELFSEFWYIPDILTVFSTFQYIVKLGKPHIQSFNAMITRGLQEAVESLEPMIFRLPDKREIGFHAMVRRSVENESMRTIESITVTTDLFRIGLMVWYAPDQKWIRSLGSIYYWFFWNVLLANARTGRGKRQVSKCSNVLYQECTQQSTLTADKNTFNLRLSVDYGVSKHQKWTCQHGEKNRK